MPALLAQVAIKTSVVFALTWMATRAMRRQPAAARHLLWALGICATLLLPLVIAAAPVWELSVPGAPVLVQVQQRADTAWPASPATLPDAGSLAPEGPSSAAGATNWTISASAIFVLVWMCGSICALLKLVVAFVRVRAIAADATAIDDRQWLEDGARAASAFNLATVVSLRRTQRTAVPLVCGIWRPTVLLPLACDGWPEERRRVVLLHELAHVKRHDCAMLALARLAAAVHWFNPLAHIAVRQLKAEQEHAADDLVLTAGTDASTYADHLLEIARAFRVSDRFGATALAMARPSEIEGRLMAILEPRSRRPMSGAIRLGMALAAAVMLAAVATIQLAASTGSNVTPAPPPLLTAPAPLPIPLPATGVEPQTQLPTPPTTPTLPTTPAPPTPPATPTPPAPPSGADAATRKRVADALIVALDDSNQRVREEALNTLASLHDERVIPALIKAMSDPSPAIRRRAIASLQQFNTPQAYDGLVKALSDSNAEIRERAATALGRLRNRRAVAPLLQMMRDANANVRRRAAWALGVLADPAAIDALTAALKDADATVREQAAQSLGWIARGRASAFPFVAGADFDLSQFATQEAKRELERQRDELRKLEEAWRGVTIPPSAP